MDEAQLVDLVAQALLDRANAKDIDYELRWGIDASTSLAELYEICRSLDDIPDAVKLARAVVETLRSAGALKETRDG